MILLLLSDASTEMSDVMEILPVVRGRAISRLHLCDRCEGNSAQQNTKRVMQVEHQDENRFKPERRAAGASSVKVQD